jgi:hypothetical protein
MLTRAAATARRRWPFLLIGALTLSCVLFAGLWLGAASAGPKRAQAHFDFHQVKMTKFDAVESNDPACATTSWTDVPNSATTFKLAGTTARNILVNVSVTAQFGGNAFGEVRLVIDGGVHGIGTLRMSNPVNVPFDGATASYTNLTSALAPGSHTAKLQFSANDYFAFCTDHWTYAILHI